MGWVRGEERELFEAIAGQQRVELYSPKSSGFRADGGARAGRFGALGGVAGDEESRLDSGPIVFEHRLSRGEAITVQIDRLKPDPLSTGDAVEYQKR